MAQVSLKAERRSELGSNAVKWLRRAGKLPAVLYGKNVPERSISITIDAHEFDRLISTHPITTLIELQLDQKVMVMIKEIQRHKVKRVPLHVDFLQVNMTEKLEFKVPVSLVGTAKGVKEGGVLEHITRSLNIACMPGEVPSQIEVNVAEMSLGAHIAAKDLTMPANVDLIADPLLVICTVKAVVEKEVSDENPAEPEMIRERKPE